MKDTGQRKRPVDGRIFTTPTHTLYAEKRIKEIEWQTGHKARLIKKKEEIKEKDPSAMRLPIGKSTLLTKIQGCYGASHIP